MGKYNKRIERVARRYKRQKGMKGSSAVYPEVFPPGWEPKSKAQKDALESQADILLFGGSAGSLKTETMLVDAARESKNPNLRAIIFRQQRTQMSDIIEKTGRLYTAMGAASPLTLSGHGTFPRAQPFGLLTFPQTTVSSSI